VTGAGRYEKLERAVWSEELRAVDWWVAAEEYDRRTWTQAGGLESLSVEWQRELVALERVQREMNNGGYVQFLVNCGRESYAYASRALKKIGAHTMAGILDRCQALVDEHFLSEGRSSDELQPLVRNVVLDRQGNIIKEWGSVLPDAIYERILALSFAYIDDPDDVYTIAANHYGPLIEGDKRA
jgi:hypothetical protein